MVKQYKTKPVIVEATQWQGSTTSFLEILDMGLKDWTAGEMGTNTFNINTLNGTMKVSKGDYITKDHAGNFYVCSAELFNKIYEEV